MIVTFEILTGSDPYEVTEPHGVFRYVGYGQLEATYVDPSVALPLTANVVTVEDEGLDDPSVDAFFVVLGEIGENEWVVWFSDVTAITEELRGKFFIAKCRSQHKLFGMTSSGYFYCPYVPIVSTPVLMDPNSFKPNKGILTRYGKKILAQGAKFYGSVSVVGGP